MKAEKGLKVEAANLQVIMKEKKIAKDEITGKFGPIIPKKTRADKMKEKLARMEGVPDFDKVA